MQVELAGCTSAGKSTLSRQLFAAAREAGLELHSGSEVVLGGKPRTQTAGRIWQATRMHAAAATGCLANVRRRAEWIRFCQQTLQDMPISWFRQANQMRKVLKQLGCYEVLMRADAGTLVLVDEGVLQAAHNIFVHVGAALNPTAVGRFAELVPLPEAIVFVRHDLETLICRTQERGHPRIPRNASRAVVADFIGQAVAVFDLLQQHERIAPRAIVVDPAGIAPANELLQQPCWRMLGPVLERAWQPISDFPFPQLSAATPA